MPGASPDRAAAFDLVRAPNRRTLQPGTWSDGVHDDSRPSPRAGAKRQSVGVCRGD